MTDAQDAEQEPSPTPYMRLPMPLVALGIVALLGLLLGAGLYANANLRPQGVVLPAPISTPVPPTAETTAVPVAASTSAAKPQPTPRRVVSPTPEPRPSPTTAPIAALTQAPTPMVVVLDATATVSPAISATQASEPSTPLPTVDPTLGAEVGQAYENFWRVRSQALLELDETHLPEVMDGDFLTSFESSLQHLAEQGRAIKTQVSLNYAVVEATANSAIVHDGIEDNSYYVVAGTEQPLSDPTTDFLRLEVTLNKVDGAWKVVKSVSAD
jgi:hypothetical protein